MQRTFVTIVLASFALVASACGREDEPAEARSAPASGTDGDSSSTETSSDLSSSLSPDQCQEGPDRVLTPLDDVTIPAIHEPEYVVEDVQAGDFTIPGFTVPVVDVPEQIIDTGCIIEYVAPGGCLGAVEITGFEIPSIEIPGYQIPRVEGPDGEVLFDGDDVEGDRADAVTTDGDREEQTCQAEPDEDDRYTSRVHRPRVHRASAHRMSLHRAAGRRGRICVNDVCAEGESVPGLSVEGVTVEGVVVDGETLPGRRLEDTEATVVEEDDRTAYIAPADVLFEFDQAHLGPDAVPTLQSIVDAIENDLGNAATITVEGHTDSKGGTDYNQALSERRAEAVRQWLTTEGGVAADRITSTGYGETLPVAPNENPDGSDNPDGRARNRRVAITVTPDE